MPPDRDLLDGRGLTAEEIESYEDVAPMFNEHWRTTNEHIGGLLGQMMTEGVLDWNRVDVEEGVFAFGTGESSVDYSDRVQEEAGRYHRIREIKEILKERFAVDYDGAPEGGDSVSDINVPDSRGESTVPPLFQNVPSESETTNADAGSSGSESGDADPGSSGGVSSGVTAVVAVAVAAVAGLAALLGGN